MGGVKDGSTNAVEGMSMGIAGKPNDCAFSSKAGVVASYAKFSSNPPSPCEMDTSVVYVGIS